MIESPDKKTYAQRRKEERKEELRELLRGSEYLRQLHEMMGANLSAEDVPAARLKAEIAFKLLAKCLPDQKAVEISGEIVTAYAARIPSTDKNAEQWQQQHSPVAPRPTMQ